MTRTKKERKLWFRAKEYGWGWTPVSWQGWAVTIGFSAAYVLSFIVFAGWLGAAKQASELGIRQLGLGVFEFVFWIGLLSFSLVRICITKGEKPGWRWGERD